MNKTVPTYSIRNLFELDDRYVIPIYQRNYAWGDKEITQLIQDILDSAERQKDTNYYIGTLVVYDRLVSTNESYETIDGQQRLTTLFLLIHAMKRLGYLHQVDSFKNNL